MSGLHFILRNSSIFGTRHLCIHCVLPKRHFNKKKYIRGRLRGARAHYLRYTVRRFRQLDDYSISKIKRSPCYAGPLLLSFAVECTSLLQSYCSCRSTRPPLPMTHCSDGSAIIGYGVLRSKIEHSAPDRPLVLLFYVACPCNEPPSY